MKNIITPYWNGKKWSPYKSEEERLKRKQEAEIAVKEGRATNLQKAMYFQQTEGRIARNYNHRVYVSAQSQSKILKKLIKE